MQAVSERKPNQAAAATLRVDTATIGHAHAIGAVHVESWRAAYANLLPAEFLAALSVPVREANWRASIERSRPEVLVACSTSAIDGEIDGFIAFGPSRDALAAATCAEVEAIYLRPQAWAQGIGRELWLAALECLLRQGFRSVTLWVLADNQRAIRFYRAAGFETDAGSQKAMTLGGATLQEVRMVYRHGCRAGVCPLRLDREQA